MAEFCTRAERTACKPCLTASRDTFELWCARYVASLPPEDRQRIDSQIPDGIKALVEEPEPDVRDPVSRDEPTEFEADAIAGLHEPNQYLLVLLAFRCGWHARGYYPKEARRG